MTRVLVVDDSASLRKLLSETLRAADFDVTEADDGAQALQIARSDPHGFELVITDLNMPELDGLKLVGALRSLASYEFVPILLLTTEIDPAKKQKARTVGATGWLQKPFDPQKLLATVARVLP